MNKIIIGIDPDLFKSGFAFMEKGKKETLSISCLGFFGIIRFFLQNKENIYCVYIEAGWLNAKSNFHGGSNSFIKEKIAKNVGENHAIGKLLEEFCTIEKIPFELVKPTKSKVNAEFFKNISGYKLRNNQEMRDAAMLIIGR